MCVGGGGGGGHSEPVYYARGGPEVMSLHKV